MTARIAHYRRGLEAEWWASLLLRAKCYRILARRYRAPMGEIDLIAARGNHVVFVEVKARATVEAAIHSLAPRQQLRLRRGAEHFLARYPKYAGRTLRFDLMVVAPGRFIRHYRNVLT